MLKSILCLLMFAGSTQTDAFKKEITPIQNSVDTVVSSTGARFMGSDGSKATYLEGYGVVVVLEVMLEPPSNPFGAPKSGDQVRTVVGQRRQQLEGKLSDLLKQQVTKMESVGPTESMAVIVHILNVTRADVPDLPKQLVLSVKKDTPDQINIREF
jgi:hypothetical protein